MRKITGAVLPVILFVYLLGSMFLGGVTLLAATLPVFTMIWAVGGAFVVMTVEQQGLKQKDNKMKA